jgi:hypothetical protein
MNTNNVHASHQSTKSSTRFGILGWIVVSLFSLNGLFQHAGAQTLTGHEDFNTTLTNAIQLPHNFQASVPNDATLVLGEYFGRDAIMALLNQPNCVGVRIYLGRKSNGKLATVLVGVSGDGHDLTNGPMLENGYPCPPICDSSSVIVKH